MFEVSKCFNFENYPLVIISVDDRLFSKDLYFDTYEDLLETVMKEADEKSLKIIFNFSKCENRPPISYLQQHVKFMMRNDHLYKSKISKTSIVLPYKSWEVFTQMIFAIRPATNPNLVCIDYEQGYEFVNQE